MSRSVTNTFSSVSNIIKRYGADNLPQRRAGEDFYDISEILSVFLHVFQKFSVPLHTQNRDVAQLVAHYVRDVGVGRSSRLIPTKGRMEVAELQ